MTWASDKPTMPGLYWYRLHADDQAYVVVCVEPAYDLVGPWSDGSDSRLSDTIGQWVAVGAGA